VHSLPVAAGLAYGKVQAIDPPASRASHGSGRLRASRTAIAGLPGFAAVALLLAFAFVAGCGRDAAPPPPAKRPAVVRDAAGHVIIEGDDSIAASLTWEPPAAAVPADGLDAARKAAAKALAAGNLHADATSAIPLYLAILQQVPDDAKAREGLQRATAAVVAEGDAALAGAGDDIEARRQAHQAAAVLRAVAPRDAATVAYLERVDRADQLWELNRGAETELREGRLGEEGSGGALSRLREALRLQPGQPRAMQGLAAVESGLIRRAEEAGARGAFGAAKRWLGLAGLVRPRNDTGTIEDARARVAAMRAARILRLRDEGLQALREHGNANDLALARNRLAELLRIADPGDPAAAELRERIELASHYGVFHPGQAFTDALGQGARGPEMIVVPHGAFRMGAAPEEPGASDAERPQHYIRFGRGFALSRTEVTVGEFRRFVTATGYRPTATRRGYSMAYDARSGNFVRSTGVDWRSAYDGGTARDDMPVVHVSARDADAYAEWLAKQSHQRYHVPSEAQYEYALRAGRRPRYPWGAGAPAPRTGNLTGSLDVGPNGRRWHNAFPGYGDGSWGPAPVGRFRANAYGLHDMAGNVSEWVADCWHDGYRRAPDDGDAWVNPGCRVRTMRGGAWASSPDQTRSAWRAPARVDTTNARLGFRVAREL
jgi:formylglycine-generating enzyme required for sulfatase activity